jgi:hypothetical protein
MGQPGKKRKRVYSKGEEEILTRKRRRDYGEVDALQTRPQPVDEDQYFYEETKI